MDSSRDGKPALRRLLIVAVFGLILAKTASADPFHDYLVQPPQLQGAARGSLVGQYASVAFGPSDVSRGGYALASPFAAPTDRGALLASPFPVYSPDSEMSPWGMGMQANIALVRSRLVGTLDYATDGLLSPWGRLVQGDDQNWYPLGLSTLVRVQPSDDGLRYVAYLPDGSRWTFGGDNLINVPGRGIYAWYLTDVESATRQRTHFDYDPNATGRLFVRRVSYGGVDDDFQYHIELEYESGAAVPYPFLDARSGKVLALDRRVKTVTIQAKNTQTGVFQERWHYALNYQQDELGPAFYLTSVTQTFASGLSSPPTTFAYAFARQHLGTVTFREVPKLETVLRQFTGAAFQPERATMLDYNQDGRMDLEHGERNTLLVQTNGGYDIQPLGDEPPDVVRACRLTPDPANPPRHLAQMKAADNAYQVVSLTYSGGSNSHLILCNREGQSVFDRPDFPPGWELGSITRVVDLNNDFQPDFLSVSASGYRVIPNTSTASNFAFGAMQSGPLDLGTTPDAVWASDVNGDGIPDIIVRANSAITIYLGLGNFKFEQQGRYFPFKVDGQLFPDLNLSDFTFVDANGDGLTDVLLLRAGYGAYLFINTGNHFEFMPVRDLGFILNSTPPVVGDLAGDGNTEIFVAKYDDARQQYVAKALAINAPETGLLISADDGKGTTLSLSYTRSPAADWVRQRHSVLSRLEVASSGADPVQYRYSYDAPQMHTIGKFLLGFENIVRQDAISSNVVHFLNSDSYAGLPLSSEQSEAATPDVVSYVSQSYQNATFQGMDWKRLESQVTGWRNVSGTQSVFERRDYVEYTNDFCPRVIRFDNGHGVLTTTNTRATPFDLTGHLHCLEERVVLEGTHGDSALDFRHEGHFVRNRIGLVEKVESISGGQTILLEEIDYHGDFTLAQVRRSEGGITFVDYQLGTRLLRQVTSPDLKVVQVTERDPIKDQILALDTNLGQVAFQQYFQFDGLERLAAQWTSVTGASEQQPNQTFDYRYADATHPASILARILIDAQAGTARSTVDFSTASGLSITTAKQIWQGWVFDGVFERKPNQAEVRTHLRPTELGGSGNDADIRDLDYAGLLAGAQRIANSQVSIYGHALSATVKFHAGVEERTTTALTVVGGELVETMRENDADPTIQYLDAAKRVIRFEDQARSRYRYRYDAMGRLVEVAMPNGKRHQMAYDGFGRIQAVQREDIATIRYTYDNARNLLSLKEFLSPSGIAQRKVRFVYDGIGRKELEEHTDLNTGAVDAYVFYYDGTTPDRDIRDNRGVLSAVTGESDGDTFTKIFQYRADGRLIHRDVSINGWRTLSADFAYFDDDSLKRRSITLKDADGTPRGSSEMEFQQDAWGRISETRLDGRRLATFAYDENGQPASADFSEITHDSSIVTFDHDPDTRRFTGFTQARTGWRASSHVHVNNRGFAETETLAVQPVSLTRQYTYSTVGFLTDSTDEQNSYRYHFDGFGLPTWIEENGVRRDFVQNGNELTVGGITYRFDNLGRTVDKGDLHFTYGPSGQLASAERQGQRWRFLYDEEGQRLGKFVGRAPAAGYFDEGYVDGNGLTQVVKAGGVAVGIIRGSDFRLLATDTRGTVTADLDGTARVASPFGTREVRPDLTAVLDFVQRGYDADLGLVRLGVRDYDPFINRFLTADPLLLEEPQRCVTSPLECNLYTYGRGAPSVYIDSQGKLVFLAVVAIAVGVGIVVSTGVYIATHWGHITPSGLLGAAAGGAVNGFIVGATGGAGGAVAFLGVIGGGVSGGIVNRGISTGDFSATFEPKALATDLAISAATFGIAKGIGALAKSAPKGNLFLEEPTPANSAAPKIGWTGKVGEDALEKLVGGKGQAFLPTTQGARFVDQLVDGVVAHESKVGYTSLTKRVAEQIAKDVELIQTKQIEGAVWHFFKSPVTGLVGPSGPLEQALKDAGIKIIVH